MKKLEALAEENAPTFCLFKDYCSQAVGENLGWVEEETNFSCFVGGLGVGEKRGHWPWPRVSSGD